MENPSSSGELLMLGALEVLLNQALTVHPQGASTLERLSGKVIRVRAHSPDLIFYCLVDPQGVELTTAFAGDADVRIRGSAGHLLYRALLPPGQADAVDPEEDAIRISGDDLTVEALRDALQTFNLWEAIRTWIREHVAMPEILGLLQRHDPAWLERLQDLPQVVSRVLEELRQQSATQARILEEMRHLRTILGKERRSDIVSITLGMLFMMLAVLAASGTLPLLSGADNEAGTQALVLAALGVSILLSRMFRRDTSPPA